MKINYNINKIELHSIPILPERKITSFIDHTMEENSVDNEIVKNPKRIKSVQKNKKEIQ